MKSFLFVRQFMKSPRRIGAFLPSTHYLAEQMAEEVSFEHAKFIVEYGPGTGVFTDEILKKRSDDTWVMLIESDRNFYSFLKRKYKDTENLLIVNGSAEDIDHFVKTYDFKRIDYIISGLPFTSLPKQVSDDILNKTRKLLGEKGRFITFQYTLLKKAYFKESFGKVTIKREYRNFPPAYILNCGNQG
ncbi:rRNA adenine N-6-methyltransferase family protein [Bacillus sp. FJAT-27251]|uniref:class I SAM-dependent methyltransferase n=1 Tax=Bacillus sp. FJAT-27251 TaxID=1684142 RepID=UPI0006A7A429|nr:rRNA adenine N-6-methyltransferase family protein [Bacillus sp. FJAT-27251]